MQINTQIPVKEFVEQKTFPELGSKINATYLFSVFTEWNRIRWEVDHNSTIGYTSTLFGIEVSKLLKKQRMSDGVYYSDVSLKQ